MASSSPGNAAPSARSGQALWIFLGLTALAFGLRLVYLSQARACPMFGALIVDGEAYGQWSDRIADGDWLGSEVFYQAPLYPYFLGLVKLLLGRDLGVIRLVQIGLGSLSCGVLFLAGRLFFSRSVGVLAGALLAFYPSAIFFDGCIQKTTIGLVWIVGLLLALALVRARPTGARWLTSGALLGLLMLTREETILLVPVLAAWLWLAFRAHERLRRARWVLAYTLGLALVVLPVAFRNLAVGGEFLLTTSQAGPNFYIGNGPRSQGTYRPLRVGRGDTQFERQDAVELAEQALARPLSPAEVSDYWFGKAFTFMRREPVRYARLVGRKILLLVNAYEVPDAENLYFYARFSPLLAGLERLWNFGFLITLAAGGLALTWARRRELLVLHLVLATLGLGVVLFYVFARYRYPLVPLLVLFAAAGLVEGVALLRARALRSLVLPVVAAALVGALSQAIHFYDREEALPDSYQNSGVALMKLGERERALEMFQEAVRARPSSATSWTNLGQCLLELGRPAEAVGPFRRAIERKAADLPGALLRLGTALAQAHRDEEALRTLDQLQALAPPSLESLSLRASVLARQGRFEEALVDLEQAHELAAAQELGDSARRIRERMARYALHQTD